MSRFKSWCHQCDCYQMHTSDYERDINGATVTITCEKCGYQTQSYKRYQE